MVVPSGMPALVLVNANVLTLESSTPRADTVLVNDGRITWVGDQVQLSPSIIANATVVDCGGKTVVPGFIDAHCHILAYAASLEAVDCSRSSVSTIGDIIREIRHWASVTPFGEWIRAAGYSEFELREKRHPTRQDLDLASRYHPVRLNHRSGHACVLNSLALDRVGIASDFEEPEGSTVGRDLVTGEPNGLLLEMDSWLEDRIPPLDEFRLRKAVGEAGRRFLSQGVTSVTDATASNSLERWSLLRRFRADGDFTPALYIMPGYRWLADLENSELSYGYSDELSTLGHSKLMLTFTSGRLAPDPETLRDLVAAAHSHGFPVAIHAVEADAVTAAAEALAANRTRGLRDRIEHASECPPDALEAMLKAQPVVATQPGFLRESGDRYLAELGDDARWLYRFKTLIDNGVVLAASSDAPVIAPNPLLGIHAAVTRHSNSGATVGPNEKLTVRQALTMHTRNAAYAVGREKETGTIAVGKRADLAVLSHDPTQLEPDALLRVTVTATIVNGEVVWAE